VLENTTRTVSERIHRQVRHSGRPPAVSWVRLSTYQPGLVDLHTDSLARFAHPRPGTAIPFDVAVHDLVADAALHGVTSPFVCGSVGEGPARTDAPAGQVLAAVERAGGGAARAGPAGGRRCGPGTARTTRSWTAG
jgi:hypothetical protein